MKRVFQKCGSRVLSSLMVEDVGMERQECKLVEMDSGGLTARLHL